MQNWYARRWEVLERDNYTCRYCGRSAPDVILHIDHVIPRSAGGSDSADNLVVACAACNLGRGTAGFRVRSGKKGRDPTKGTILNVVADYIGEHGPSSATQIAVATKKDRTNISTLLASSQFFMRHSRVGASVLYALRHDGVVAPSK